MSGNKVSKSQKGLRGAIAFTEELANQMIELKQFESWLAKKDSDEYEFRSMTIKASATNDEELLIVLRFYVDGKPVVGFSGGVTLTETLLTACRRMKAGVIKWKDDQYG